MDLCWRFCVPQLTNLAPLECEERAIEKGVSTTRSREILTFAQSRDESVAKMKLLSDQDLDADFNVQMGQIFQKSRNSTIAKVKISILIVFNYKWLREIDIFNVSYNFMRIFVLWYMNAVLWIS